MRPGAKAIQHGSPLHVEFRFRDGATNGFRWFLGRSHPTRDEAGNVVRWYGTLTDIDRQKHTEHALQEAGRRQDEFLAMLSHELRNPLAPILNSVELLRSPGMEESTKDEAREIIDHQVRHLSRLLDDLLDMFGLRDFNITLSKRVLDLVAVVRRAVEDRRDVLEASQRTVALELPGEPIHVLADEVRITQVMANILRNAAKFTRPRDWISVRVTAGCHPGLRSSRYSTRVSA